MTNRSSGLRRVRMIKIAYGGMASEGGRGNLSQIVIKKVV
jgi:hypothetical protein